MEQSNGSALNILTKFPDLDIIRLNQSCHWFERETIAVQNASEDFNGFLLP